MNATILDLRYRMKDVLNALDRCEPVHILYHGKEKGVLYPTKNKIKVSLENHPAFGMWKDNEKSVESVMEGLRGGRYRDI
jgi:hypothetical protein